MTQSYSRKSWSNVAFSPVSAVITAALLIAGLVIVVVGDTLSGLGLVVAGLLTFGFSIVRVVADENGLTVRFGLLPWARRRIPLHRIAEAGHREVRAVRDFGGWGYRFRPGRTGVILRSGDALIVELTTSGREFAVTVDDARTGAAVLNGFVSNPH